MRRIPIREGADCKHLLNRTPGVCLPSVHPVRPREPEHTLQHFARSLKETVPVHAPFYRSDGKDVITVRPYDAVRLEDRAGGGDGGLLPRPHKQAGMRAGGALRRGGSERA